MLTVGSEGLYQWLVTDEQFDFLQLCPQLVLGKYIAVTSIDSSPLFLTDKQTTAGWQSRGRIAYSPKIRSIEEIPCAGWDEWYIFDQAGTDLGTSHIGENIFETPQAAGHLSVFVNYCFAPHQPQMKDLADMFWKQITRICPESYLADNDYLTYASLNPSLFGIVRDAIEAVS